MSLRWQSLFFMAITLKQVPHRKAIPLINSTCHTFTNNCVAYLADICDILPLFCYKNVTYLPLFCYKHLTLFRFIGICIRIDTHLYAKYTHSGIIK